MALDVSMREGGVAVATFQNAERMNSFDADALRDMHAVFRRLLADDAVRSIVLTGEGRMFCAGADMEAFQAAIDEGRAPEFVLAATQILHPMLLELHESSKPLVAAVNGAAAGGGLGLALVADARIGTPDAKFAASYFRLGVSPDGGSTWLLPRIIGEGRARRFFFDNEVLGAEEAERLGLVDRIIPAEDLVAEAVDQARRWGAWAEASRSATKRLLGMQSHVDFASQLEAERGLIAAAAGTADFREGVAAFRGRREPRFA